MKIKMILILIFLSGCAKLGMPKYSNDKLVNVLVNKNAQMVFLVGEKYTHVYSGKKNLDSSLEYRKILKLIDLLKSSEGYTFLKKPEIKISRRNMLNGTSKYKSNISLSVEIHPSKKQIAYFNTLREGFRDKHYDRFSLGRRGIIIDYRKTRCILGICSDEYEEYILEYRTSERLETIRTTSEILKFKSKITQIIPLNIIINTSQEDTKKEIEKNNQKQKSKEKRQKEARKLSKRRGDKLVTVVALTVMLPVLILASPIGVFHSMKKK